MHFLVGFHPAFNRLNSIEEEVENQSEAILVKHQHTICKYINLIQEK